MRAVMQVRTIIGKEWTEMRGHKFLVAMVGFLPLLLVGTSIALLFYAKSLPVDPDMAKLLAKPMFVGMTPQEGMQAAVISTVLLVFLIMPLYIPLMIATYSIIGEKLTHTLEPLLAAPVSTRRLLLGKGLAAAAPGIAVTWVGYGMFLVAARFATLSPRVWAVFVHRRHHREQPSQRRPRRRAARRDDRHPSARTDGKLPARIGRPHDDDVPGRVAHRGGSGLVGPQARDRAVPKGDDPHAVAVDA